ncbi:hypothetical protein [Listeria newyorkensis]|uniref:hypothetical protein n=1 Tax=Listeria newyorkensis TaxID=1497681 RepID=UPI00051E0FDD|nr:hypothetical protein [Listeria newyorkensis]KGL43583.1 hypothetical protein EP58_07535 [Listeria newyorkensis]
MMSLHKRCVANMDKIGTVPDFSKRRKDYEIYIIFNTISKKYTVGYRILEPFGELTPSDKAETPYDLTATGLTQAVKDYKQYEDLIDKNKQ